MLVVLFLPDDMEQWLTHSPRQLVCRKCAYWLSLRNAAQSANRSEQTVYLPRGNLLSVEKLRELMARFSRREVINYET